MDDIFMLCEKVTEKEISYLKGEYLANIKYDGCRVMSFIKNGEVVMLNRRGKIVNFHFKEIENELKTLPTCILDGEIISYDNQFEKLQRRALTTDKFKQEQLTKEIPCYYMVFDILSNGEAFLQKLTLKKRIEELKLLFSPLSFSYLKLCEYNSIDEMLKQAREMKGEGIIIKDMNGIYETRRSKSWLKLKFFQEQQITITKYTLNNAGIRAEDNEGNVVQISGRQSYPIKQKLDKGEQVEIFVQYLTKSEEGRMRFISYRGLAKELNTSKSNN